MIMTSRPAFLFLYRFNLLCSTGVESFLPLYSPNTLFVYVLNICFLFGLQLGVHNAFSHVFTGGATRVIVWRTSRVTTGQLEEYAFMYIIALLFP